MGKDGRPALPSHPGLTHLRGFLDCGLRRNDGVGFRHKQRLPGNASDTPRPVSLAFRHCGVGRNPERSAAGFQGGSCQGVPPFVLRVPSARTGVGPQHERRREACPFTLPCPSLSVHPEALEGGMGWGRTAGRPFRHIPACPTSGVSWIAAYAAMTAWVFGINSDFQAMRPTRPVPSASPFVIAAQAAIQNGALPGSRAAPYRGAECPFTLRPSKGERHGKRAQSPRSYFESLSTNGGGALMLPFALSLS